MTAGSPLNSLVLSVARYFGRLPEPVHVAAWVDDLHFSMRMPAACLSQLRWGLPQLHRSTCQGSSSQAPLAH
jgi:hypothetical protein